MEGQCERKREKVAFVRRETKREPWFLGRTRLWTQRILAEVEKIKGVELEKSKKRR